MPAADHIQVIRNLIGVLVENGGRASAAASSEIAVDREIHIVRRGGKHIHANVGEVYEVRGWSARDGKPRPCGMQGIDRGGIDRISVAHRDRLAAVRHAALRSQQQVVVEGCRTLVVGEEIAPKQTVLGALVPVYSPIYWASRCGSGMA